MAIPIIYCAKGNRLFAEIAIESGMHYGAQMPGTVYYSPYFVDQDWKKPDRDRYVAAVAEHRPRMATVLDWERDGQLPEVLSWAEDVAPFVEQVVIIPKVMGGIPQLPRRIAGREVVLGYSVPTKYGGTELPLWEFAGWPVHLLGGSPHRQLHVAHYCRVNSVDGNYIMKKACMWEQFWTPGTASYARDRFWPTLHECDGEPWGKNKPYEAFRRSCVNIMKAWRYVR